MGREAVCIAHWQGGVAEARALLESAEIILRGGMRARIARGSIRAATVSGHDLVVDAPDGRLVLELGEKEAGAWARALARSPPGLAEKLGATAASPCYAIGAVETPEVRAALAGAVVAEIGAATRLIAELRSQQDLETAMDVAQAAPKAPIWLVHPKGPKATPKDAEIRAFMRARSYADIKTSAVSDAMTATCYAPRRDAR